MTIPLDKLYHYIKTVAQDIRGDDVIIYRFYPHGDKNLNNLTSLRPLTTLDALYPPIYCNDQEPLNYELYADTCADFAKPFNNMISSYGLQELLTKNLKIYGTIYDKVLLLNSERRSVNLARYEENGYIGVYYWSHAIIALDWFRYAQHDSIKKNSTTKKFLVYNRAWSGTREYRLKLVDLLIQFNLINDCQISVNPVEPELGIHYSTYQYSNPQWQPVYRLEDYVSSKEVLSSASADYEIADYNGTEFELVLETLFEDTRLHLTEKILRPIALGQPFLLAATHGSLEYLQSYGFKTFSSVFDESYDTIEDPYLRLTAIVKSMKEIASWTNHEQNIKLTLAKQIAEYNRNHFFSEAFSNQVNSELRKNLSAALDELEITNTSNRFLNRRKKLSKHTELKNHILHRNSPGDIMQQLQKARSYYMRSLSDQ